MNESSFNTKNPIVVKNLNNANIVYVTLKILYCIKFAYIFECGVIKCVGLH